VIRDESFRCWWQKFKIQTHDGTKHAGKKTLFGLVDRMSGKSNGLIFMKITRMMDYGTEMDASSLRVTRSKFKVTVEYNTREKAL